ncbi:zinc-binding dehydrogenase [Lutimaribacter marinistellae]|uniref:Zinc-binding dehydrogenase n=1 Tax=Lutimaribacter marinistellae TaxID=1820329 RepID=A0ABV7TMH1_9RHOB
MKALVYEGTATLVLRDVPGPEPESGEELVQIDAAGICGSDMHAYLGHDVRRPAPLILGHEAAGTVVRGARSGKRVTINPLVTCRTCLACKAGRENICEYREIISMPPREGAFAQFVTIPASNLVVVPDHVSFGKAALAEPLAVGWHAVRLGLEALATNADRRAIVLGGGAIGLAASLALKAQGLTDVTIVEPNEQRRAFLSRYDERAAAEAVDEAPIVVDAVGYAATRAKASALVAPGGVVVHIGLGEDTGGLDIRRMTLQEITFIGTYTYSAQDFRNTCEAMFDGRLGPLDWFETRSLSDGAGAFDDLRHHRVAAPKIVLTPWS